VQRGDVRGFADVGVGVDRAAAPGAQLAEMVNVSGAVDQLELALGGRRGTARLATQPVGLPQSRLDREHARRRVRVIGRQRGRIVVERGGVPEIEHVTCMMVSNIRPWAHR